MSAGAPQMVRLSLLKAKFGTKRVPRVAKEAVVKKFRLVIKFFLSLWLILRTLFGEFAKIASQNYRLFLRLVLRRNSRELVKILHRQVLYLASQNFSYATREFHPQSFAFIFFKFRTNFFKFSPKISLNFSQIYCKLFSKF